jgi:hypothetical protein
MAGKQEMRDLVQRLLELVERLRGSTCFTKDELKEIVDKLRRAVDELEKVVG